MNRKTLTGIQIKDADQGLVTAAFAKLEVKDEDSDWTLPGAFGEQDVRISAYGHRSWSGELPVGKGQIHETKGHAILEGQFFLTTEGGRETFEVVKQMGDQQEWSYGFDILETGEVTDDLREKGVEQVLAKLKVHEVSPVLVGAGVDTRTLAVKDPMREFSGLRFVEQVDQTIDAVMLVIDRAKAIAALRKDDGRDIAQESVAQLTELKSALADLDTFLATRPIKADDLSGIVIESELIQAQAAAILTKVKV